MSSTNLGSIDGITLIITALFSLYISYLNCFYVVLLRIMQISALEPCNGVSAEVNMLNFAVICNKLFAAYTLSSMKSYLIVYKSRTLCIVEGESVTLQK